MSDVKTVDQNGVADAPVKTEKQLKKEAEKAAKLEKLKQKLEKKNAQPAQPKEKPDVIIYKFYFYCNYDSFVYILILFHGDQYVCSLCSILLYKRPVYF